MWGGGRGGEGEEGKAEFDIKYTNQINRCNINRKYNEVIYDNDQKL